MDDYNNTVHNHYWRDLYRRYEYAWDEELRPELLLTAESMELKIDAGE